MQETEKRVNRIIGQMKGIEKMLQDERSCTEILQQIAAVKKAIDGLTREITSHHIGSLVPPAKQKEVQRLLEQVLNL